MCIRDSPPGAEVHDPLEPSVGVPGEIDDVPGSERFPQLGEHFLRGDGAPGLDCTNNRRNILSYFA